MEINLSFLPLSHYKETVGSSFKIGIETISRAINQSQMDVTVGLFLFFLFLELCQGKLSVVLKIVFSVLKKKKILLLS